MTYDERRLVRHLAWVVVIKLLVLVALWWGFVRDQRVNPDVAAAVQHIAAPVPAQGASR